MTDPTSALSVNTSAGHLSVHFEGYHPVEVPFQFEQQQKRIGPAALASFAYHVAMIAALLFAIRFSETHPTQQAILPEHPNANIIWLNQPGPGGGGGGGGNRMQEPPRKAELPGKDKITVPVEKPPSMQLAKKEPDPVEQLNIPAKTMASAAESLPGAIDAPPGPPTLSQGSGSGGGTGTGTGTGIGPGTGSGLGPGSGGGTGGGVYRPGNGITNPSVLREVKPQYTSDAMRAKVQGTVLVETVVKQDGSVGDVQVLRSLDPIFGLDQQAIAAAKQWRFRPCTRQGEPVSCAVTIELTFTLR
ncbi:MAG TPA: TonB family protein [Vicinamibacterales bacterium]|nr:TonB family protein [Vicinamibacterales bacterium]